MNAVYHRSYQECEPIEVRIDQDAITIISYPWADRSVKMEDLKQGKAVTRRYRNRRIGEFLKELDLTKGRSTGIPKILRVVRANGSPMPIFETDDEDSYFLIRLPIHDKCIVGLTPTIQNNIQVTVQDKSLVEVLSQSNHALSAKELMEKLGLKNRPHFAKKFLKPALEQGLIEMTIPDKPNSRNQKYWLK